MKGGWGGWRECARGKGVVKNVPGEGVCAGGSGGSGDNISRPRLPFTCTSTGQPLLMCLTAHKLYIIHLRSN